jgi:hypothetical protein
MLDSKTGWELGDSADTGLCGLIINNNLAEGGGFEPPIGFEPYTRFPGVRLKPLGHPSLKFTIINN